MPKIQLTIKTTYLSSWGSYEGIRELVQNARDAEVEGHALTVDWYNDTLRIENAGASLPTKALLLGHTTKEGRSDQIGKFGEGLKLGVLALVRAGHSVKIRNGEEVWTPYMERSETFDEDVLAFRIEGGREKKDRLRVEVGGITKDAWEKMKECFLFLQKPKKDECVETPYGTMLIGDQYKGKVYVKGIFVQTDPDLQFGYNLQDAELDRDRKMVESYNLRYHTKNVLVHALNKQPSLRPKIVEILEQPTTETENILDPNSLWNMSETAAKFFADDFQKKHGTEAIPVSSLSESKEVEHLGKKGVVVSRQLGAVLAKTLGDALTVKESLKKEVVRTYSWGDLDAIEQASLTDAVALVNAVEKVTLDDIDIVDFRSELMGQFKDGRIALAKKYLVDADETLATLIHEVAHRGGGDGEANHVRRIENLWKGVVAMMRRRLSS